MAIWKLSGLLALLSGIALDAVAQEPTQLPESGRQVYGPKVYVNPYAKSTKTDKLHHIEAAAEHLKSAGLSELAEQVRAAALRIQKEELLHEKLGQLQTLLAEIAELRRETGQAAPQILLQLTMMEVDAAVLCKEGVELWERLHENQQPQHGAPALPPKLSGANNLQWKTVDEDLAAKLAELREADLIRVLAEPTIVTVSGHQASFHAGGEFPILVPQILGGVAVEYRTFGTRVDCLPALLPNGRLRLEIRPELSEIDPENSVTVGDTTVPGLRTRRIDAAVEVEVGSTTLLAGLQQAFPRHNDPQPAADGEQPQPEEETQSRSILMVTVTAELIAAPPLLR